MLVLWQGIAAIMDGHLARMTGRSSSFGHWYDYLAGGGSYAALFAALGVGLSDGLLGQYAMPAGMFVGAVILLNMTLRMKMDRDYGSEAVGYPGAYGFELEDGIYLIGPITWFGGLEYFFPAGCAGVLCFVSWTVITYVAQRSSNAT